jgi:hypothetical protein
MIQLLWALFVSVMVFLLTWVFSLLSQFDDGLLDLQSSAAVALFGDVAAALADVHKNGEPVPCGTTAEAVEDRVLFVDSSFKDVCRFKFRDGRFVFRLHFEIDADNVSNDHVLFVVPFKNCVVVLSSYVNAHPATVQFRSWRWLGQLDLMVKRADADAWKALFEVTDVFVAPVSMCCHVSVAML